MNFLDLPGDILPRILSTLKTDDLYNLYNTNSIMRYEVCKFLKHKFKTIEARYNVLTSDDRHYIYGRDMRKHVRRFGYLFSAITALGNYLPSLGAWLDLMFEPGYIIHKKSNSNGEVLDYTIYLFYSVSDNVRIGAPVYNFQQQNGSNSYPMYYIGVKFGFEWYVTSCVDEPNCSLFNFVKDIGVSRKYSFHYLSVCNNFDVDLQHHTHEIKSFLSEEHDTHLNICSFIESSKWNECGFLVYSWKYMNYRIYLIWKKESIFTNTTFVFCGCIYHDITSGKWYDSTIIIIPMMIGNGNIFGMFYNPVHVLDVEEATVPLSIFNIGNMNYQMSECIFESQQGSAAYLRRANPYTVRDEMVVCISEYILSYKKIIKDF